MNRRELRGDVYLRTGYDTNDALITTQVVNQVLNDALHFISLTQDWPWLEDTETLTTVSGTATVTPAENWVRTRNLTYSDGTNLELFPIEEYDRLPVSSTGQPDRYTIYGGLIRLWPIPDGAYTIYHRYLREEASLGDDGTEPLLPTSFQPALVEYAAHLLLSRARDEERAKTALDRYREWERVMTDNRRRYTRPPRVQVRPGGWT